jgi:hypothetical protein
MPRNLIVGAILGLGLFAAAGARAADVPGPMALTTGTVTLTLDGWTVSISSCSPGGTPTTPTCGQEEASLSLVHGNLALTYQPVSTNPLSVSNAATQYADYSLTEAVTAPTGDKISQVAVTLTGTTAGSGSVFVDQTEVSPGSASSNTYLNSGTTATGYLNVALTNSVVISKDIDVGGGLNTGPASLTSVTQVFNVPEPASLSLLAIGFGGLFAARRRRQRAAV